MRNGSYDVRVTAELMDVVCSEHAVTGLQEYFDEARPHLYTGRRFEVLAGGGDRLGVHNVITAGDLLAVQMLSVSVPAEVAIDLLDGGLGRQMADLLTEIPVGVELGTDGAKELIADGQHADRAWRLLKSQADVGYVIAGKLMARKRPHLIPVYDQVIRCLYGKPDRVWLRLNGHLVADGGRLRDVLSDLRARAGIPITVGLLRILDVVLWMSHHGAHRPDACPGFSSVPLR